MCGGDGETRKNVASHPVGPSRLGLGGNWPKWNAPLGLSKRLWPSCLVVMFANGVAILRVWMGIFHMHSCAEEMICIADVL